MTRLNPSQRDDQIGAAILKLAAARGPNKTICPSEVARDLGGADPNDWRPMMNPIKTIAIALAQAREIELRQGGKAVGPDDVTGIYRIAIAKS